MKLFPRLPLVTALAASQFAGAQPARATPPRGPSSQPLGLATEPESVDRTLVFASGSGAYNTFRIPAIVTSKSGELLALAEGRKAGAGDAGNIDIVLRRSRDQGQTWSPLQVIWADANHTCGNPCPVMDREMGTLWLLLTWSRGDDHESQIIAQSRPATSAIL